jgi:PKD repeat protein
MKKVILKLSFILLLCSIKSLAQVSPKRGLAYGGNSVADINALKPGISWWYNWTNLPDPLVNNSYASLGVEYVPMAWNGNINVADFISKIKPGAKYLLTFNEPNLSAESNMTPEQAVAAWPQVQQIAAAKNLEIVSAAAIYVGSGAVGGYTDPVKWHQQFFNVCPTCKVDYIAFHTYERTASAAIFLANNLAVFNRPVWVTEFSDYNATSDAEELQYMKDVVTSFENNPDIFRYSWFTGRRSAAPVMNILGADGVLTNLGTNYITSSYSTKKMAVPGRITANKHYRRKGTGLETTNDGGTSQDVCYIDAGDWAEFMVQVGNAGSYNMTFRMASLAAGGKFDIQINGVTVKTDVSFAATGGWQTWVDVPVTGINLPSGEVYLKIVYKTAGYNFNYIDVVYVSSYKASAEFSTNPVSTCVGNAILFTDLSTGLTGAETYSWDFGSNASPATATGHGPIAVSYSTPGQKSPQLIVSNVNGSSTMFKTNYITITPPPSGCLFADDFVLNTTKWFSLGAFSYTQSGSKMTISNAGYGQWDNFTYTLNDGTSPMPINFNCANNKPILKVKAKASVAGAAVLTATLVDGKGRAIDNVSAVNFELSTSYQVFQVDFTGKFKNINSPTNAGPVDSTSIVGIQFSINPGYASPYFVVGPSSQTKYNSMYTGTVDIDWAGIGSNCQPPITSGLDRVQELNTVELYPNPFHEGFVIKVNQTSNEKITLKILDVKGSMVFSSDSFTANQDLRIGEDLENGVYTVVINDGANVKAFKMIKIK